MYIYKKLFCSLLVLSAMVFFQRNNKCFKKLIFSGVKSEKSLVNQQL